MPTTTCNTYEVTSDKIVLELGSKNITTLSGQKGGADNLTGTADKIASFVGLKQISALGGTTGTTTLSGLKYISDLSGLKNISALSGTLSKSPVLLGSACEGTWYIHADTTYKTADSCLIKADNCG